MHASYIIGGAHTWHASMNARQKSEMHNSQLSCLCVPCMQETVNTVSVFSDAGLNQWTAKLVKLCTGEASVSVGVCDSILSKLKI